MKDRSALEELLEATCKIVKKYDLSCVQVNIDTGMYFQIWNTHFDASDIEIKDEC